MFPSLTFETHAQPTNIITTVVVVVNVESADFFSFLHTGIGTGEHDDRGSGGGVRKSSSVLSFVRKKSGSECGSAHGSDVAARGGALLGNGLNKILKTTSVSLESVQSPWSVSGDEDGGQKSPSTESPGVMSLRAEVLADVDRMRRFMRRN